MRNPSNLPPGVTDRMIEEAQDYLARKTKDEVLSAINEWFQAWDTPLNPGALLFEEDDLTIRDAVLEAMKGNE